MPVTLEKSLPKIPLLTEFEPLSTFVGRQQTTQFPVAPLRISCTSRSEDVVFEFFHEHVKALTSADELGFACLFSLGPRNELVRLASHEAFEQRRSHERREHCHNHQRGEKSLRYDAALEPDIDNDQFH